MENILYKIKTSQYSYGFKRDIRKGSPLVYCAEKHKNNLYVLKLDLKNFYPSIKRESVCYIFKNVGYNADISNLLTNICVVNDELPQGAVTSPYLANLVCRKLDFRIAGYCNKRNIVYTRYADDFEFSSEDRELLRKIYGMIKKIVEDEGFCLNQKKTVFMTPKNHKEVLGVTINDGLLKAHKDRLYYPVCQAISYLFIVYFMGWILFFYVVAKFYCGESLSHEYTKMKNVVHYGIKNVSCLKTLGFKA